MKIGFSVFVPCVNTEEAIKQASKVFKQKGWEFTSSCCIEDGKWGVRFWRTK